MKEKLQRLLQAGIFTGVVVILIDAIDLLPTSDFAHSLDWLPPKLAKNVKVIVTCSVSEERHLGNIDQRTKLYHQLCRKIPDEQYFLRLEGFSELQCSELIINWQEVESRQVNFVQWRQLKALFKESTLPLYIKLLSDLTRGWTSYDHIDDASLPKTVQQAVANILKALVSKHSHVLVSRVLGYITLARDGITEQELLDVLCLDDVVLNHVHSHTIPAVRRFPAAHWLRLKQDVAALLAIWQLDHRRVLGWKYSVFKKVFTAEYLAGGTSASELHSNMADYYLGKWSRTVKKPFK